MVTRRTFIAIAVAIGLAGIVLLGYGCKRKSGQANAYKTKRDLARPRLILVESAIEIFNLDCGQYPDDSMGLNALLTPPAALAEKWDGPYLKPSQLLDPWDNPIIYIAEGEINPGSFDLMSLGADGVEGGEGDNEDIFNE